MKHTHKLRLFLLSAMAFTGLSANAQVAVIDDIILPPFFFNYDSKTFHGSECQPLNGNSGDFRYYNNRIYNASSGARWVVCPVVRDNTVNTNGTFGTEVYINNIAGQNFQCILYSWTSHGGFLAADAKNTVAGGAQTLRPDVNISKDMGNYSFQCLLPRFSSLYSYKVKEWWTGNNPAGRRTDQNN